MRRVNKQRPLYDLAVLVNYVFGSRVPCPSSKTFPMLRHRHAVLSNARIATKKSEVESSKDNASGGDLWLPVTKCMYANATTNPQDVAQLHRHDILVPVDPTAVVKNFRIASLRAL